MQEPSAAFVLPTRSGDGGVPDSFTGADRSEINSPESRPVGPAQDRSLSGNALLIVGPELPRGPADSGLTSTDSLPGSKHHETV